MTELYNYIKFYIISNKIKYLNKCRDKGKGGFTIQ